MPNALIWFRHDLRLADNPALQAALEQGYAPICVYVHAPEEEGAWRPGAASGAWLHRSLEALEVALRERGGRLRLFAGPTLPTLQKLISACGAEAVFWNRRHEPEIEKRDAGIQEALRRQGLRAESFNGALLFEPRQLQTRQGGAYKVFTPFWRAACAEWRVQATWDPPARLEPVAAGPAGVSLASLALSPRPSWDAGFWETWTPGEAGAREVLAGFVDGALRGYGAERDRPDHEGTSRLSPHLHLGEIAPWRVVRAVERARTPRNSDDVDAYLRQLGWREFAHHLLHHFPASASQNLQPRFDTLRWARASGPSLEAWRTGRTGVPIVDAGMRQLWHTGWMHNRVRMIAASYLTKHLRQHWLVGARWFWDTLVDADLANNTLGWQWVAGTGADASPYFRIFNPVTQAKRFDPQGHYVAAWVPEVAALPVPVRFAPWTQPELARRLAPGYPAHPVVGLEKGRDAALEAYRGLQ